MKKLFSGKFLFILASSIVVLIGLVLGALYLFDDDDDAFIKSGYVLNPLSSTSEKYFFDKDAGYKENLSSMIEFIDVDKNTVTVLKDSFLHYSDDSISFLKKGAILDLGSIKGNNAVSFYNISSKSIIEKKDSGYFIESAFGDINLTSFLGRISDNKYILAGDLSLKMPGNAAIVKGDYFEIVYIEEGIVNIENKENKFQVAAEGTVISIGSHIKIDLGDKKIINDNVDVMSITALTIDGDENIEIIPKVEEEEEETEEGGGGSGSGDGTGDGNGNGSGGEGGEDGNKGEETDKIDEILITIKDIKIGSTDVDVIFEIQNAKENDAFKLQIVNLNSGRTVDIISSVVSDELIQVNLLTPSTKYLFSVVNEKDNAKYFQKVIETSGFGIKMEKEYATNNSLSYKVSIDEEADITNAKLTLYVYNEETKQNEVVKKSYTDTDSGEVTYVEQIVKLADLFTEVKGEHSISFTELDSDTIYTAVLDEFSVASYNFKDIYNITLTAMTLKDIPTFTEMTVNKNVGTGSFDLSLGNIKDPDNAITKYTYLIYDKFTDTLAIQPIVHSNASPLTVEIGEGDDKLKNDTNYYYKVIIEYYDNEKYIEYVTTDSIIFMMGNDPYITIVPDENAITHDKIVATIYLTDNSCLVSMPDREKCNGPSTTVLEVSRVNSLTGERVFMPSHSKEFTFDVNGEEIKYELYLDNLQPGTLYNIEVKSMLNNSDSLEPQELLHTDESKRNISTKSLATFNVKWGNEIPPKSSSANHVVYTDVKFESATNSSAEDPETTLSKIETITLKLYQGKRPVDFSTVSPIGIVTLEKKSGINFKEIFYETFYDISSSDTFGFSIDQLKKFNAESAEDPGYLTEYYTLLIEAYVDGHSINLVNPSYEYKINSMLLLDPSVEPVIKISSITNSAVPGLFPNLSNSGTVVGYKIAAAFDKAYLVSKGHIPQTIQYYVFDGDNNPLKFYVLNNDGELELKKSISFKLGEEGYHETSIYMDYGTAYGIVDEVMSRGNSFKIGYVITIHNENGVEYYPMAKPNDPMDIGLFANAKTEKENPGIKMYVSKSTNDSVIYKYEVKDPDSAMYSYSCTVDENSEEVCIADEHAAMYYSIGGGANQKVELTLVPDATFRYYMGELTIPDLVRGNTYKIFYKKNIAKTGSYEKDVLDYLDIYSAGDKIFEGYYDPETLVDAYNFKYGIINARDGDNKVGIAILANEKLLDRILSYRLEFTATYDNGETVMKEGKVAKLTKELWQLSNCVYDNKSAKCLYVDYTELKNAGLKSEYLENSSTEITKHIKVTVTAYYDNGLMGYDYKVGSTASDDYPYMIMQDDLINYVGEGTNNSGGYIAFSAKGTSVTVWTEALKASKGYYTYAISGNRIQLKSHLLAISGKTQNISISLTSNGYSSTHGYLNPKMVSVKEMSYDKVDTFSFANITPKVSEKRKTGIINGTLLSLSLSGVDLSELVFDADGNYYVYIETWSDDSYNSLKTGNAVVCGEYSCHGTVRPAVRAMIDKDNPLETIEVLVDGLATQTSYYHQVYVVAKSTDDVDKRGYKYTQLIDASANTKKAYKETTAKATEYFKNVSLNLEISQEIYGNRSLKTGINLLEYGGGLAYNFDLIYVLCDIDQVNNETCGIVTDESLGVIGEEGAANILQNKILLENLKKDVTDIFDISSYDIEYGKKYYVNVYAMIDYYDTVDGSPELTKINVGLNAWVAERQLRFLSEPTFEVTREAGILDNKYYIDFNVTVKDPDRTLIGGVYYIKLEDSTGANLLEGAEGVTLLAKNADGIFEEIPFDTSFDALELNKVIRISGLSEKSAYSFTVYNDVYINNYDVNKPKEERRYEISRSYTVYTTNTYGVSFGQLLFNATANSFVVTFKGGSSFEGKVVRIEGTIQVADALSTQQSTNFVYNIPEDNQILISKESSEYYFVINNTEPPIKNIHQTAYNISLAFTIEYEDAEGKKEIVLDNIANPGFNGTVMYVEK